MSERPLPERPLSKNRNFHLLWSSQAGSELTNQVFVIVYPLLALAVLGSPAAAGAIGFVLAGSQLVAGLPAGWLADHWDRRRILLLSAALRTVGYASVGFALWTDSLTFVHLLLAAVIEGVALTATFPAEEAALPQVVSPQQLPTALAMNSARVSLGQLLGNSAGGILFGLSRMFPFLLNAVLTALSFVALLFLRIPKRPERIEPAEPQEKHFWRDLGAGVRWMVQQPVIRLTAFCAVILNLSFTAVYLVVLLRAQEQGAPAAQIGLIGAMLGVGGILGALAAAKLHQLLSPYASVTGVVWAFTVLAPVLAFVSEPLVAGGLLAVGAFLAPTANTTIMTYQLLLTPDEMRGRLSGAMGVLDGTAGALGPALGGVLMQFVGSRNALLLCAALMVVPALVAAVSPTLRGFRGLPESIDEGAAEKPDEERIST